MKFELVTQEYVPSEDIYVDWTPKMWDDEQNMWMDSETGLPWCDHKWESTWAANTYNAYVCSECGERNY